MFTGIVKELGVVRGIGREGKLYRLAVESAAVAFEAGIGGSIAVNGVCLTVTKKEGRVLYFDAVEETIRRSALGRLTEGAPVNLEGSLKAGEAIGGHFVLGHVDCVGRIRKVEARGEAVSFEIEIPREFAAFVVEKGSVAIDGVSLTVGAVSPQAFRAYLIPHTLKTTTLGLRQPGDTVNIEFDMLGKYILRSRELEKSSGITEGYLREKGYV